VGAFFIHFRGFILPIAEDFVVERHYSLPFCFALLAGPLKVQPDSACIERVCVLIEFIILAERGEVSLNRIRSGVGDSVGYLGARKVIGMLKLSLWFLGIE